VTGRRVTGRRKTPGRIEWKAFRMKTSMLSWIPVEMKAEHCVAGRRVGLLYWTPIKTVSRATKEIVPHPGSLRQIRHVIG
jgi:DNA mismatch repair protein MutH